MQFSVRLNNGKNVRPVQHLLPRQSEDLGDGHGEGGAPHGHGVPRSSIQHLPSVTTFHLLSSERTASTQLLVATEFGNTLLTAMVGVLAVVLSKDWRGRVVERPESGGAAREPGLPGVRP